MDKRKLSIAQYLWLHEMLTPWQRWRLYYVVNILEEIWTWEYRLIHGEE